jgi:Domain of unknown function (DUF1902)
MKPLTVNAIWDEEAQVWVTDSRDVPGFCTEASTLEALHAKLEAMIPELIVVPGSLTLEELRFRLEEGVRAADEGRTSPLESVTSDGIATLALQRLQR